MGVLTLEALRDAIRASKGADDDTRRMELAFAELVLRLDVCATENGDGVIETVYENPALDRPVPSYLDPIAGPGTLFAAARERWPECCLQAGHDDGPAKGCRAGFWPDHVIAHYVDVHHPFLAHALALAMVEAAIAEAGANR